MHKIFSIFVTTAKGLEYLLAEEIKALNLEPQKITPNGVILKGSLKNIYQLLFELRLASRVLVKLYQCDALTKESIYESAKHFHWAKHFSVDKRFSIQFNGKSPLIKNSMYGAMVIKDGICDYFLEKDNQRPSIDKNNPDIHLIAYLKNDRLNVYLDVLGEPLHKRGYRQEQGLAPLRENLAAAILRRAKFHEKDFSRYGMIDPCCGSGTFLIEAALMALNISPHLLRDDNKLDNWLGHFEPMYYKLKTDKRIKQKKALHKKMAPFIGYDKSPVAINIAIENAEKAGVGDFIQFETQPISAFNVPDKLKNGLFIANPPYGERMGDVHNLVHLYEAFGNAYQKLGESFDCALLTSDVTLAKATNLRSKKQYHFRNGMIDSKLYLLETFADRSSNDLTVDENLLNRLDKNLKKLKSWQKQHHVTCFRVYDADLPEYNAAIDIYQSNDKTLQLYAHIQEYQAPKNIPLHTSEQRLQVLINSVKKCFSLKDKHIATKQRKKQEGQNQYQAKDKQKNIIHVSEGNVQCIVNLFDYLDTGLFLDHRKTRLSFAKNKMTKFLNLFCYTGVASLHAAKSGAKTYNVDLSKTYLDWAKDNFKINQFDENNHHFINADVEAYLDGCDDFFDVIFLDPPSFSNSKKLNHHFDIVTDHSCLINKAIKRLSPNGKLIFSTNKKGFKLDEKIISDYHVTNVSNKSIDKDFNPKKPPHCCFEIKTH